MKVTILGCGPSGGVPLIGCECPVCTSSNPKNNRTRVSILIETHGKRLLVDTPPDLRQQCLRHHIKTVDAILYTHAHADHTHGIDDARSFNYHANKLIPAYGTADTLEEIRARFAYVFKNPIPQYGWFRPALEPREIRAGESFDAEGVRVIPFDQGHGAHGTTLGFRVGDMAYTTDAKSLPDASFDVLKGIKLWIVDCLSNRPMPTHSHLEQTLEWIARVRPERAILTHMGHELEYATLNAQLPTGVEAAFDGMVVMF
ncbi:MAG: MBL fold metallo-hydrolase [Alphaproteobacteria bacterium]|nr:MBL fold metallo-hydrolase [Alphaproteobacteria bacterium]